MAYKSKFTGQEIDEKLEDSLGVSQEQEVTGVKNFSAQPIMTAEIAEGDNSTNIPNTAWVQNELSDKVDKVDGKQLSTEDYTTEEKNKLASLENYNDTVITERVEELENAGFITKEVDNLANYELKTNTGSTIALSIDHSTYVMSLALKNSAGDTLSSDSIDLPIESMVVNATYQNGTLTLTLQNGNTLDVDISAIISGLVPDTRTVAGLDLKDDISQEELLTAVKALPLSGGQMTGEIKIGQNDGNGIQLGENGRINATDDNGNTNRTVLGVVDGEDSVLVGHGVFKTRLRGSEDRPKYNNNDVALFDDIANNDSVKFAESERQKSKNLFRISENSSGGTPTRTTDESGQLIKIVGNNTANNDTSLGKAFKPITMKAGQAVTLSVTGISDGKLGWVVLYSEGNQYNDSLRLNCNFTDKKVTKTFNSDATLDQIYINTETLGDWNETIYVQVEYGSEATDWNYPYGAISHTGDKEIEFAKEEHQKSKNKFDFTKLRMGSGSVDYVNETITVTQYANSTNGYVSGFADLEVGKEYIVTINSSSSNRYVYFSGSQQVVQNGETFTCTQDILNNGMLFYGADNETNTISQIMFREVGTDDSYQQYNGNIVHEKQLEEKLGDYLPKSAIVYDSETQTLTITTT